MSINVMLVDDHQLFLHGLRLLLEQDNATKVVGEATDGRTAIELAKQLKPDVLVMDVSMPGMNGIEATRQLKSSLPQTKTIALSAYSDKTSVVNMLSAGACGYVLKECAFNELAAAVAEVFSGKIYLSSSITGYLLEDFLAHQNAQCTDFSTLTTREREVLQMLAEGRSSKEIADQLFISPKTVDVHRQHIMEKLQLNTMADLVKYALREGMISL